MKYKNKWGTEERLSLQAPSTGNYVNSSDLNARICTCKMKKTFCTSTGSTFIENSSEKIHQK